MEVIGVFNPGAIATNDGVFLLVRVAEQPVERRLGFTALPRWDVASKNVAVDWIRHDQSETRDQRVIRRKQDNLTRLTFLSHLRVIRSRDGKHIDSVEDDAAFWPANTYEEFGVEDPRITRIDDTFYITYVAVSRHGVVTALASTKDFKSFERHGILFPPENKDVVLFPERIGRDYYALHRPNAATPFTKPEMWMATSSDLIHWGHHEQFLGGSEEWDIGRIGAGTPPIRTAGGWLALYHGNSKREEDTGIGIYSGGALLLDLDNPRKIVGRSGRLFVPETKYELEGFVPNVVFPTGMVLRDDVVLVYYGAADTYTAVVEFSLKDIFNVIERAQ
jgi:predicted GH43/DUF377 family glycosyl hydrolase